ncbi:MAG TPA: hypothetical protein VGE60_11925 [Telluria sp.]
MKKTTLTGIMLAVAVLATGCTKQDNDGMGPAQEAGKAVDEAGATVARETEQGLERADQAAERAAANVDQAAERAEANIEHAADHAEANLEAAGAEVRQESREAAADVKRGVSNATNETGKAIERTGEKIQDASK